MQELETMREQLTRAHMQRVDRASNEEHKAMEQKARDIAKAPELRKLQVEDSNSDSEANYAHWIEAIHTNSS